LPVLGETVHIQEYSARFEFDLAAESTLVDVAGGLLDPETDRLPGVGHDLFAVRRGLTVSDDNYAIDWIGVDNRVVRLRKTEDGRPIVLANLVNNFPEAWNRWEANDATLSYRFAVRGRHVESNGAWSYTRFAWESTSPVVGRYTWLRSAPASGSFLSVDGQVVVSTLRRDGNDLEIRLINPDTRNPAEATIRTDPATNSNQAAMGGQEIRRVSLIPGEIATVRLSAHPSTDNSN
jgi:hypothetical protein